MITPTGNVEADAERTIKDFCERENVNRKTALHYLVNAVAFTIAEDVAAGREVDPLYLARFRYVRDEQRRENLK